MLMGTSILSSRERVPCQAPETGDQTSPALKPFSFGFPLIALGMPVPES